MSPIHNTRLSKLKLDIMQEIASFEKPGIPDFASFEKPGAPDIAPPARSGPDVESAAPGQVIWTPSRREWLIMVSLSIISLIVALDATILVTALPNVALAIHGSAAETFWVGSSYLLTCAVFQPLVVAACKHLGSRLLLVNSITLFSLGTLLCAIAKTVTLMILGRCIQGIGGGGIITMTQIIFCEMVPFRQLPHYFTLVLGSWAIGSLSGPVVGGLLVEHTSWRWCFYINFPFCGIGLIAALICTRDDRMIDPTILGRKLGLDWNGACSLLTGTASVLVGVSFGGIHHPWTSVPTLLTIILGLLTLALFAVWQLRSRLSNRSYPISCPLSLLAAYYCAFANGLVLYTALYYVPLYLLSVGGLSTVRAGIDLLPALGLFIPVSIVVSILITRLGYYRWAVWSGWAITTLGCGLIILFDMKKPKILLAISLAVFGVGNGMVLSSVNAAAQAESKPDDRPMAASMYAFMRSLGMPVGVAVSGSIFQNAMARSLSDSGLTINIARDAERFILVLRNMADTDPTRLAVLACYTRGFKAVFICMTAVSTSALLLSFLIKARSMNT